MESNHLHTKKELHWVYQSMVNWAKLSTNRAELKKIADTGYDISFYLKGILTTDNIHAYFGYYQDRLYLHFIPSSQDITTSFLDQSVIPVSMSSCIVTKESQSKGPIEKKEAEIRIQQWNDDVYRNQVLDTMPFFQLFWIPNDNFKDNTPLKINFAIHKNEMDLVLTQLNTVDSYLDTCKPIPPFKPSFTQNQFALLDQIKVWSI